MLPSQNPPGAAHTLLQPVGLQSDAQLAALAATGSEPAWRVLYDRHLPRVVRVLARVLGNDPEIPDLANEVFVVAYQSISRWARSGNAKGYLAGVAVNVAKNRIRSKRRGRWLVFGEVAATEPPAADPTDARFAREALRAMYVVLDLLEVDLRICFSLRFIEGMELTEVAEMTGTSLATVKRRLEKAERAFREHAQHHPPLGDVVRSSARWGDAP